MLFISRGNWLRQVGWSQIKGNPQSFFKNIPNLEHPVNIYYKNNEKKYGTSVAMPRLGSRVKRGLVRTNRETKANSEHDATTVSSRGEYLCKPFVL